MNRSTRWARSPRRRARAGRLGHVLLSLVVFCAGTVPVAAAFIFDWPLIAKILIIALAPTTQLPLALMIFDSGVRRYPPVHPEPRTAVVIGSEQVLVGGDFDSTLRLIKVAIHQGPQTFTSLLADNITGVDRDKFSRGSKWQVHEFCHSRARVALTAAHDDLWREGYELSGLRLGSEYIGEPGYGSEIVARGFRSLPRQSDARQPRSCQPHSDQPRWQTPAANRAQRSA